MGSDDETKILQILGAFDGRHEAYYMLGASMVLVMAEARRSATEEDKAFLREISRRLYATLTDEAMRSKFSEWIRSNFFS